VGLQTRAFIGQRFVRIRPRAGQHSVQMGQHSCAKGLQTGLQANTQCEWCHGWKSELSSHSRRTFLAHRCLPVTAYGCSILSHAKAVTERNANCQQLMMQFFRPSRRQLAMQKSSHFRLADVEHL
jgi:hypothetical protein